MKEVITALDGDRTLGVGVGSGTTLITDVVIGDTLIDKRDDDSGAVVMSGGDIIGITGGGYGKSQWRTVAILRISFYVSSPNVSKWSGGLGSLRRAIIYLVDWCK